MLTWREFLYVSHRYSKIITAIQGLSQLDREGKLCLARFVRLGHQAKQDVF